MISLREYVQNVNGMDMVSISSWGMFPITIPQFEHEVENNDDIRQAVKEDLFFAVPHMMRQMKTYKEGIAAYANRLG